jgi:hypothetical protein
VTKMKQTKLKPGCGAPLLHRIKFERFRRQKSPSNVASVMGRLGSRRQGQLTTKLLQCMSPLMAQSGHHANLQERPLST